MLEFKDAISYVIHREKCVGMVALDIKSVPDYQLFYDKDEEAIAYIKRTFSVLLNEVSNESSDNSMAIELLWYNTFAQNQSFLSYVNLMVVIRVVDATKEMCLARLQKVCTSVTTTLNSLKIVTQYCAIENYHVQIEKLKENDLVAIKRPDEIIPFDIAMFPYCYKYDIIPDLNVDLDLLVNTLINERDSAVIIQLIPTRFSELEKIYISNCLNSLHHICQGMPIPRMGFYRDPRAEIPLRTYKKYYESINSAMVSVNILCSASKQTKANIPSRVISLLNDEMSENNTNLEQCALEGGFSILNDIFISPWVLFDRIVGCNRSTQLMNSPIGKSVYRLAHIYSPTEAAQIFRTPIGTRKVTAGVTIHEVEKRNKKFVDGIVNVAAISVGRLQNIISSEDAYIGFNLKDLTKHMLVVGTPGSGKSTFLVGLMDRLWKQPEKIPFLVIEPAKNEYRSLIDSIPDLQVFSPGKNNVAPFVLNPFVPPRGVSIEKYKSIVKSAFSAAFEMWTPLDQLFDETLNICYSEQGWLDSTVVEECSECFSLVDFIQTYKEVVGSKGYSGEYKKQIEAAGVLRFNGLIEQNANIFDSRYSVPIEDILKSPTVIELSNIKDVKQKSFVIALLLNNIYAYVEANNINDGKLKNVILLEEAHALLCGESAGTNDTANSNAAAVKLLTDMLAEIRSRGVGIVIADQSPKKVTSAVIANTNIKVMFRLVEADDKDIVKRSTVMDDHQRERLSKLKCGQALLFFDKLDEVEEVEMDDYRLNNGISTDLSDEAIKDRMVYWKSHGVLLKPYRDCDCIVSCSEGCILHHRESARVISDRIFRKYYPKVFNDIASFAEFYKRINYIIREETVALFNDEGLVKNISCCVKVHLLRKINYYTDINIDINKRRKIYSQMMQIR